LSLSKSATADLDAQARNPYTRSWLWIPGSRFARPGMTRYYGANATRHLNMDLVAAIHAALRKRDRVTVVSEGSPARWRLKEAAN
jgi:hypothetical protein